MLADVARVHHEVVDLTVLGLDQVDQAIQHFEAVGLAGNAELLGCRHLALQTVERIRQDRDVAVDQRVLELATDGLGLTCDLNCLLIVGVGHGRHFEVIDFGIADDRNETGAVRSHRGGRLGRDGVWRRIGRRGADTDEVRIAQSQFAVERDAVTSNGLEREDVINLIRGDDRFDHALNQRILLQLCCFRKGQRCHVKLR